MKKYFLFLVLFSFATQNPLLAQVDNDDDDKSHIHVIIKTDHNSSGFCSFADETGKVTVSIYDIGVLFYNYDEVYAECGSVTLEVYNSEQPRHVYSSIVFDPEDREIAPEGINHLCDNYYFYNPVISFSLYSYCNEENNFSIPLGYRVIFTDTDYCHDQLFPHGCYPPVPSNENYIYDDHEVGHTLELPLSINCCSPDPFAPDAPGVSGNLNPRKAAPAQIAISDFQVTPNPFNTDFQVAWTANLDGQVQFDLFDGNNRLVKSQRLPQVIGDNQHAFNTADFANGFYYLRIKSGEEVSVRRLVKIQ